MGVKINDAGLVFSSGLTKRTKTTAILLHHRAGTGDVQSIHRQHISANGWSGIGYNFYIRQDGSIYKGRGWEYTGAHAGATSGYNGKSIGICFEGNFSELTQMPAAQYNAGVALIREALRMYGDLEILGHKDVYPTSCPGSYFPLTKMKAITLKGKEEEEVNRYEKLSDIPNDFGFRDVIETLMNAKIINGDGSDKSGNDDVIDLSHDQVRSLVFEYRGGAFDRKLIKEGIIPAVTFR